MKPLYNIGSTEYRYHLSKSAKKWKCPQCGRLSFTPYVDANENPKDVEVYGRCDRQDKCTYNKYPYDNDRDSCRDDWRRENNQRQEPPKPERPTYITDVNMVLRCRDNYDRNPLARFLHSKFDALIGADKVTQDFRTMGFGTSGEFGGSAAYILMDWNGNIRTVKIMGYDATTGKRIKDTDQAQIRWLHKNPKAVPQTFTAKPCYFGSHLIATQQKIIDNINADRAAMNIPGKVEPMILAFESEKAALIMKLFLTWGGCRGTFYPIAVGGCGGLNPSVENMSNPYDKIQVLKNRRVMFYPDEGKFEEWRSKIKQLRGFAKEAWIASVMERDLHPYTVECEINKGDGFDDLILRYIDAGIEPWNLFLYSMPQRYKLF